MHQTCRSASSSSCPRSSVGIEPLLGDAVRERWLERCQPAGRVSLIDRDGARLSCVGIVAAFGVRVYLRHGRGRRLEPECCAEAGTSTTRRRVRRRARDSGVVHGSDVGSTTRSSTVRSTASAARPLAAADQLRRLQTGYVRTYALGDRCSAPSLLLAWFLIRGCSVLVELRRSSTSARASLPGHRSAARSSRCSPTPPARVVTRSSASLAAVAHRRAQHLPCSSASTGRAAGFQFVVEPRVDPVARHLVAPRRRRHLAVPRRAHRRPVPARARSARRRTTTRSPTTPGCSLLEAGCIGVFLSLDLFLFFVLFEIVLVPMYFLIGQWGHGDRVYAAIKFFLFTMFGSAFMLVGIVATGGPAPAGHGRRAHLRPRRDRREPRHHRQRRRARWLFLGVRRSRSR